VESSLEWVDSENTRGDASTAFNFCTEVCRRYLGPTGRQLADQNDGKMAAL
jgi:hypothetical protein